MPPKRSFLKVRNPADQINSRLTSLPAELRNTIYEMALSDHIQMISIKPYRKNNERYSKVPGIVLACRQTYAETINVYYATVSFLFSTSYNRANSQMTEALSRWVMKMGQQRCRLTSHIGFDARVDLKGVGYLDSFADERGRALQEKLDAARAACEGVRGGAVEVKLTIRGTPGVYSRKWWPEAVCWTTDPTGALKEHIETHRED